MEVLKADLIYGMMKMTENGQKRETQEAAGKWGTVCRRPGDGRQEEKGVQNGRKI